MSSEESAEVSRLLREWRRDHLGVPPAMLPAQPANEIQVKTSIFKLAYSDGNETQIFLLPEGETLVGRSQVCNLVIKDPSASRRHARFEVKEGRCFVEDLGSSAGTCKNGEFVTRAELRDGDVVSLGQMQFAVREPAPEQVALSGMHTFTNATVTLQIAGFASVSVPREPMRKRVTSIAIVSSPCCLTSAANWCVRPLFPRYLIALSR